MTDLATPTRVISADCHICEPPHVFESVPSAYRDRAPKMMRGADGGDGWSFDGGVPKRTFGIEATAGQTGAVKKISGLRFEGARRRHGSRRHRRLGGVSVERHLRLHRARP
jgi:hypothetical protein